MKYSLLLFAFAVVLLNELGGCTTGKTTDASISHGGLSRTFKIYVPTKYDGTKAVPLLFNLHGYTSNASEQMTYADFRPIADTANFLLVVPQGATYMGQTHWNTGGWTPGSTVDDLGFIHALIDYMGSHYKIDNKRIYVTGMSNGGEMSYHLACNASNRIAAIASVCGSMTPETYASCHPTRPVPVMHIHGTRDNVVPYIGDATAKSVTEELDYWIKNNGCNATPTTTAVPNINTTDGSTAEHIVWLGDKASVVHYKVNGGEHTWPGTTYGSTGINEDFSASLQIWKFFNRYDLDGLRK